MLCHRDDDAHGEQVQWTLARRFCDRLGCRLGTMAGCVLRGLGDQLTQRIRRRAMAGGRNAGHRLQTISRLHHSVGRAVGDDHLPLARCDENAVAQMIVRVPQRGVLQMSSWAGASPGVFGEAAVHYDI